jgi:hypothetical protein
MHFDSGNYVRVDGLKTIHTRLEIVIVIIVMKINIYLFIYLFY